MDWLQSACPVCCLVHWEIIYMFPPAALVCSTVANACMDQELCLLVVPVAILAQHWHKLLITLVLPPAERGDDGFLRVRAPSQLLSAAGDFVPHELAIFPCDFR